MTAFSPPCHNDGEFFDAIGDEFDSLQYRHEMISADVLDARFPRSPKLIAALTRALLWFAADFVTRAPPGVGASSRAGGKFRWPASGRVRDHPFCFFHALPVAQTGVAPFDFRSRLRRIRASFGTRHRLRRHAPASAYDLNREHAETNWLLGDPIRPDFSLCASEGQKQPATATK